jgi:hypothetical protein
MTETHDYSRKRLAGFLAARIRARQIEALNAQRPGRGSGTIGSSRSDTPSGQPVNEADSESRERSSRGQGSA